MGRLKDGLILTDNAHPLGPFPCIAINSPTAESFPLLRPQSCVRERVYFSVLSQELLLSCSRASYSGWFCSWSVTAKEGRPRLSVSLGLDTPSLPISSLIDVTFKQKKASLHSSLLSVMLIGHQCNISLRVSI